MKAIRFILIGISFALMQSAFAEVDLVCQSNCTDKGYNYNYCNERCSYGQRQDSNNGYQSSGALGAYQQGQRQADQEAKQQLDMIKQILEIQKMKQELEMMKNQNQQRYNN